MHYENQGSDLLDIKIGIPQGSILGPLFFSIYINGLVNASKKLLCLMYANDTTTVYTRVIVEFVSPKYSFILGGGGSTFTRGTFLAI